MGATEKTRKAIRLRLTGVHIRVGIKVSFATRKQTHDHQTCNDRKRLIQKLPPKAKEAPP